MTIDRASVEHGARLAAEATPGWWMGGCYYVGGPGEGIAFDVSVDPGDCRVAENLAEADAAFIAHWNPEFAAELARDWLRLKRVEDAARAFLTEDAAEAELVAALLANPTAPDFGEPLGAAEEGNITRAAVRANPAAEEGTPAGEAKSGGGAR